MNLILRRWYVIIITTITSSMTLSVLLLKELYGAQSVVYLVMMLLSRIVPIIGCILWILAMNLDVVYIIRNSFDFWFKMWNLLIWEISFAWINIATDNRVVIDLILSMIAIFVLSFVIFCIDGVPMGYYVKRNALLVFVLFYSALIIVLYFTYENVYVNPLEKYNFEHTRVSVKDLFLGSLANVLLFVGKPIFGDTGRWLFTQYLRCTSNIDSHKDNNIYEQYPWYHNAKHHTK